MLQLKPVQKQIRFHKFCKSSNHSAFVFETRPTCLNIRTMDISQKITENNATETSHSVSSTTPATTTKDDYIDSSEKDSQSQDDTAQDTNNCPKSSLSSMDSLIAGSSTASKGTKRKLLLETPGTSLSSLNEKSKTKKIRENLIDDKIARKIFRELDLDNKFLNSGKVLAWALDPEHPDFINIHDYIANSQDQGGVRVMTILRVVSRADARQGWFPVVDFKDNPKVAGMLRMMLWHGTPKTNVASILENGLRCPFHGAFFADRVALSAYFCQKYSIGQGHQFGYLFLCDVLLGNIVSPFSLVDGSPLWRMMGYNAYQSSKCCGLKIPDPRGSRLIDGCIWPMGKNIDGDLSASGIPFPYNEFIIHNPAQIQPKYLIKVEFTGKPVHENIH